MRRLLFLPLVVFWACASDAPPSVSDAGPAVSDAGPVDGATAAAGACVRDPVLIAAKSACRSDDVCPCGTHCALGECVAACTSDAECGGVCDDFGRCRGAGATGRVAPLEAAATSRMLANVRSFPLTGVGGVHHLRVVPEGGRSGPARIVGRGAELRCTEGAAPSTECRFDGVPAEGREIVVRFTRLPGRGVVDDALPAVEIFDASGARTVVAVTPVATDPQPIRGRYAGFVWLDGTTEIAELGDHVFARSAVEVRVFDDGRVAIHDDVGGLLQEELVLATSGGASGAILADVPAVMLYAGATPEGAPSEVWLEALGVARGQLSDGLFELATDVRLVGLDLEARGLPRRLMISASRVEDLPADEDVPALSTPARPTADPLRGRAASPLRQALEALADAGDVSQVTDRAPFSIDPPASASPVVCFASEAERGRARAAQEAYVNGIATECAPQLEYMRQYDERGVATIDAPSCAAAWDATGADVACRLSSGFDAAYGITMDACAAMAARYGCVTRSIPPGTTPVMRLERGVDVRPVYAVGVCRFPRVLEPSEARCLGTAACFDSDAALSVASDFEPVLSAVSGEPACREAVTAPVLEASTTVEPRDLLAWCQADVARVVGADVGAAFDSAGCLDKGRLMLRLERATEGVRRGRGEPVAEATAHRMVQIWLQVHALIARVALNGYREDSALATAADPTGDAAASLEASLSGWDLVLQPSVAGALVASSSTTLSRPDPRPLLGYDALGAIQTARVGVAVDLLETVAAQAELLDELLRRAWFEGNQSRIRARRATAARLLRVSVAVSALAEQLYLRAQLDAPTTWDVAWRRATPRYKGAIEQLSRRIELLDSGANPIGIEDVDLPLYQRGAPLEPEDRFGATTRFLVGEGPGSMAIAPLAIDRARVALDAARARWSERRAALENVDQRIQDIKYRYGELITGYCGASIEHDTNYAGPGQVPCLNPGSQEVFDCPEIDTQVCFVEEACRPRPEAFREGLTAADLGYSLCVAAGLRETYGANLIGATREVDQLLARVGPALRTARSNRAAFPLTISRFAQPSANVRTATVVFDRQTVRVPLDALGALDVRVPEAALRRNSDETPGSNVRSWVGVTPYEQIRASCEEARQATLALRPTETPIRCEQADECPRDQVCRQARCTPVAATDPLDTVDCYYDGAISEQAIAVRGAANEIAIARAELDELVERYNITKQTCLIHKAGADALASELEDHNKTMKKLDAGRTAASAVEAAAAGAKDCAAAVSGTNLVAGAAAGVSCGAAAVEGAAKIAGAVLDHFMREAERAHDATMQRIQANTELRACFNDASLELVGARAATLRIERARQEQAIAVINLRGQKSYTLGLFNEGNAAVAMERARLERSLPSAFAQSEAAELYARRMAYAQRVTYLAVRAAEYEFQASLNARQQVLAATRPDQLEQALGAVTALVNANRVGGASPGALHAVLSLRQHLLQLGDHSQDPPGLQALTDVERFRVLLTSDRYAVWDGETYLGQKIPFTLAPLRALGRGQTQGVPIVADNDCAERVWSVNAAVLGTGVYEGNEASFTRLDLLKQNTFYSQWCATSGDADFQVASVRPALNLFLDPADPNRERPDPSAFDGFTRGRMQPYLNVSRADLEREDYAQGGTRELAGRGLYGDYALFIPAAALSLDGGPGLRLERIDDILLRVDYVSVARN